MLGKPQNILPKKKPQVLWQSKGIIAACHSCFESMACFLIVIIFTEELGRYNNKKIPSRVCCFSQKLC